jgi:hypothetical protein
MGSNAFAKYGIQSTTYGRLQTWQEQGVWKNIHYGIIKHAYSKNEIDLKYLVIDFTTIIAKMKDE